MIWTLKNITVHLWLTVLFAIPLSFYILPGLTKYFPGINPLIVVLFIFIAIAALFSFLMDLSARKIIAGLLKEGQAWERSGILNKAEKNYIKILRLYDTFLLWPFTKKKIVQKISGAIAKFNLNSIEFNLVKPNLTGSNLNGSISNRSDFVKENQNFTGSALVYLKMNPEDKDIARLWLIKLRKSNIVTSFDQEILSLLAEIHCDDTKISTLIIDIFLGLERKDFIAKKLYQHIVQIPEFKKSYATKIETLIGKPEDTLQQQVSFTLPRKISKTRKTTKAVVGKETFKNSAMHIKKAITAIVRKSILCLKGLWTFIGSSLSFLILSFIKVFNFIKKHEKIQFYLKTASLLIVSAWLLFFVINTVSHIIKPGTTDQKKIEIPIEVSKPFTIQVAAYLRLNHAQRFVTTLKKHKIDAIVKKIDGGGKTWFVVRISEFVDKKSAAAYGKKLKKQKIIDDFFVNNK